MASKKPFNLLKFSVSISLPLLIDLAYQEAYLVPLNTPNLYSRSRLEELVNATKQPFRIPPSLTFVRYHTENPLHAEYVHSKKSLWRYNVMWSFIGVVSAALQANHIVNSLRMRKFGGAMLALSAMGVTWTAILVEGNARRMYVDAMQQKVLKEEEVFDS